uniref:SF3b1 domain-containing protein n=1 Tax=Parastrongyloides trichosuri TaxID=131310 RepID=A0A0N4ZUE1_PARTI
MTSKVDPSKFLQETSQNAEDDDVFEDTRTKTIADRQNEYQKRWMNRVLSPERVDPMLDQTPDCRDRNFAQVMQEQRLLAEQQAIEKEMIDKAKTGTLKVSSSSSLSPAHKKAKLDDEKSIDTLGGGSIRSNNVNGPKQRIALPKISATDATPRVNRWDETPAPGLPSDSTPVTTQQWDATPAPASTRRNRWDETPKNENNEFASSGWGADTPTNIKTDEFEPKQEFTRSTRQRSRWDQTPSMEQVGAETPMFKSNGFETPSGQLANGLMTPGGATPVGMMAMGMQTPAPGLIPMTPSQIAMARYEQDIENRNRPLSDEELAALFPSGYKIVPPPPGYVPLRTPSRKLFATPTPLHGAASGFFIPETPGRGGGSGDTGVAGIVDTQPKDKELPPLKPSDLQHFEKLCLDLDESVMTKDEKNEIEIMTYLLKIKNGTPQQRKSALRKITENARRLGAGPLFNQILPLLMSPSLEDQERHFLVKVIDRILYKLDDLVRPYVHKILVVIEPLLIDEDYYARVEGREIISNLSKAAGLATMISTMRPDIDNPDEYVRNTTARAFAVVGSALGIPSLILFLKAVCKSKKSWHARHTGIKIVQQLAILMGCAIVPHLKPLVEIVENGLKDEQQKVRTITALCLAALAEAATPYGIDAFDSVFKPLWHGIRTHRGKNLAAFLKAIGHLIPLMDATYASYYTKEVMIILKREFNSPDDEMKKIVLKVLKQCCGTEGVEANYIREDILDPFFKSFWTPRMAMDRRNYVQVVDTTVEIAMKVGSAEIIARIVDDLKDENEQYRKMVIETIECIITLMGANDIDQRLEELLIDGIMYAFTEQTQEDAVLLNGFGTVVRALGLRSKAYLQQIGGTILFRLNNKTAKVRQQSADLISQISSVLKVCDEVEMLKHLGLVLFEYLGEEYPEVLGSIIGALNAIVDAVGMTQMTPPIKDLLPRLTPILKNRHEKVLENCVCLVGKIADRGSEFVSAREWMRICFELLDLLKAHKKSIRRASINTFGYIAKAIGPHDVLATLLNNLKVQERQLRVCTTVAIAIVAESCAPFTVLPAIMNEYRVPDMNVQNGVLKALSFMFEYIGEMAKDYVYAVTPLLVDALMERDIVHRQIAIDATAHLTLGVYSFGCEDALTHLLNHVWPNLLESSPHVIQRYIFACDAMRVSIGPIKVMQYCLQGLWHPARKVREPIWKVFNNLILGSQDALVAGYPRIENTERNTYIREELDYVI